MIKNAATSGPGVTRAIAGLVASLVLLGGLISGCGERAGLPMPKPPPGFEALEPAVRAQYLDLVDRLDALPESQAAEPERGRVWGELGQWFQIYRFPDSALASYERASDLDRAEARWPYYLGLVARDSGQLDRAEAAWAEAARRAPEAAMVPIRQAELMLARQQPERARALFEEALALDPDQRSARVGLARLHLQQRRPEQVIELLASNQQDAALGDESSYLLAQAYRQVGDLERARAHLDRLSGEAGEPGDVVIDDPWMDELAAINLSSNFLTRLGARAYDRGAFDIAAHHAGRAAALNPDNAELIANHAAALLGLDRPRAALARVEAALAIDPELARAHLILGSIQRRLGASIAAEQAWRRVLELDPEHREARLSLARSYKDRGEIEAAITEYGTLREAGSEVTHLRFWYAALLAALGRHDEALTAIESDLARQPDATELELLQLRLLALTARDEHELVRVRDRLQRLDDVPAGLLRFETEAMLAATAGDFEHAIERQLQALNELEQLPNTALAHHARRRLTLYRELKPVLRAWDADEPLILHPATRIAQGQPTQ